MYRIGKVFTFSASHQLMGVADDHPCKRLHGHNYVVEVELSSQELNAAGFVRDYLELAALKDYIDSNLDHRHLNDVLGDDGTTAEALAKHLYDWSRARWQDVTAVRVSETPKTWAEYRPRAELPSPEALESFEIIDPWSEVLTEWLASRKGRPFTTLEALREGLGLATASANSKSGKRCSRLLRSLGFGKKATRNKHEHLYLWRKLKPEEEEIEARRTFFKGKAEQD